MLQNIWGGGEQEAKESIKQMMKNNLQAFSSAKTEEVKRTIQSIEHLIGKNKENQQLYGDYLRTSFSLNIF